MKAFRLQRWMIITAGLCAVIAVVVVSSWYRAHVTGLRDISFFVATMDERPEGDEFVTQVVYLPAFGQASEPAEDSKGDRSSPRMLGSAIAAFFDDQNFINARNPYEPQSPNFKTIESLAGDSVLRVSEPTVVDQSDDRRSLGYSGQRKVAIDREGNILVAYRTHYDDYYQIFLGALNRTGDGYVLVRSTEPLSERTLGITQRVPALTVDDRDLVHVVWYGSDNETYPDRRQIVYAQNKGAKNFWRLNNIVSYVEGYESSYDYWQEHPSIELGDYDDLYVVWEGKDANNDKQQVKFSRSLDGGKSWNDWENVHPASNYTYSRPTLVYTNDGTLHLFAYSSYGVESATNQIHYAYSDDQGTTWTEWEMVSEGAFDARHISATVLSNTPVISYRAPVTDGGPAQVMLQQVNREFIGEPVLFAPSNEYQFFPSITALTDGSGVCITWIEEDTASGFPNEDPTDGDIHFGCTSGTTPAPAMAVYNLTPTGSHLYPNLPRTVDPDMLPIAYYDDEAQNIVLRLISLTSE